MDKLALLWEYQLADLALESYQKELKDTPTRKKLVKLQRFVQSAQTKVTEMENASRVTKNKISELEGQLKSLNEDMVDLSKDMGYYSECDDEELDEKEITALVKNCEANFESINHVKKQILTIRQDLENGEKTLKELFLKMKAAKSEYDVLKVAHNKELESGAGQIQSLQEALKAAEAKVDKDFLAEYQRIKGFKSNPVAILAENRCSGCRMQLPASVTAQVMSSGKPVTCENCGRILIIK